MGAQLHDSTTAGQRSHLIASILIAILAFGPDHVLAQSTQTNTPQPDAPASSEAVPNPTPSVSQPTNEAPQASKPDSPKPEANILQTAEEATITSDTKSEANGGEDDEEASSADATTLDESGLSKSAARGEFNQALLFAPEDNKLGLSNPQLKWNLEEGATVNLGGLKIPSESIDFNFSQSKVSGFLGRNEQLKTTISFSWPEVLTQSGTLTIETREGKVAWTQKVGDVERSTWAGQVATAKQRSPLHAKSQWGIVDAEAQQLDFLLKGEVFRACLTDKRSETERARICTGEFAIRPSKTGGLAILRAKAKDTGSVMLGKSDLGPRGIANFKPGRVVTLKVKFASGAFIEIASKPAQIKLLDVVQSKSGKVVLLTGEGLKPLGKVKDIKNETNFWSPTGIERESVWQLAIPRDTPIVRVLGAFNVPFTLLFKGTKFPKESDRVYVSDRQTGTYSSTPTLYGYRPPGDTVSSKERSAKNVGADGFEWTFGAPKKGQDNRARLIIKEKDGSNWVGHHSIYRGHPFEASGRLTGVITTDAQVVVLGELAASVWLESLGITDNKWLALQRWGITTRYFQALSPIELAPGQSINEFTVVNADLKYNLVNGLWNRDELVGLIASGQRVNLSGIDANLVGFGGYWARTMPKVFDDIFNIVPLMRYPKYVDVEFTYYPLAVSSGVTAGVSYNLNFHGKVFWTKNFFGEAGFGLKSFEYTNAEQASSVSFSTAYGTAGIGIMF